MKVFLSSTCYESRDLRSVLEDYLRKNGHQTLLSDRHNFKLSDPSKHRHDICLEVAGSADLMILIIEPRFGAEYYGDKNISITWAEFRAACCANVSVIVFIRRPIFDERKCWQTNRPHYKPAHCNDVRIFSFIDEVQTHPKGFWVETAFDHVNEIITKLERTGGLHNYPRFTKTPMRPTLSRFTHDTQEFISNVTDKHNQSAIITNQDLQMCIAEIRKNNGKYQNILQWSDMQHYYEEAFYYDDPIRPAEDDGSSWYCVQQVGPKGKRVFDELSIYLR